MPYVLTNCQQQPVRRRRHPSTRMTHVRALRRANKYGGIYVPTNMAVIHATTAR